MKLNRKDFYELHCWDNFLLVFNGIVYGRGVLENVILKNCGHSNFKMRYKIYRLPFHKRWILTFFILLESSPKRRRRRNLVEISNGCGPNNKWRKIFRCSDFLFVLEVYVVFTYYIWNFELLKFWLVLSESKESAYLSEEDLHYTSDSLSDITL